MLDHNTGDPLSDSVFLFPGREKLISIGLRLPRGDIPAHVLLWGRGLAAASTWKRTALWGLCKWN